MPGASLRERIDAFQQRHRALAFPYAVNKRYGEDRGKHYASLISYYGFFSLFPLLLAFVSLLGIVLRGRTGLQQDIIDSALGRFPVLGDDLTAKGAITGNGWALAFGLAAAIWAGDDGFTLVCFRSAASYVMGLLSHSAMPGSELA